jgi:phospholipase C
MAQSAGAGDVLPATGAAPSLQVNKYIKHIVIIVQENRSLNNFFGGYPGADAPLVGKQKNINGVVSDVTLTPTTFAGPDIDHMWAAAITDWDNGKMDGYPSISYQYVNHSLTKPLWDMAHQYVLADHMYTEEFGPSFTAHLSLVASTTNLTPDTAEVNYPDGAWRCNALPGTTSNIVNKQRVVLTDQGPFPCFTQFNSIAQVLDKANVSWKWYNAPLGPTLRWDPFDSIKYVWDGPDETRNIIQPQQQIIYDAQKGVLPTVSWVTPDWYDSDHTGNNSDTGPSWVTAVVNAIGQSPEWDSTAVFVTWDDWGGWYDNSPPPQKDFTGLGMRVPFLLISPYAKKGYVEHEQYEFASTLKFIEQTNHLPVIGPPSFGYTDTRAANLLDMFDFTQKPRPYTVIHAKYPTKYFLNEKPSFHVPDEV